MNDLNAKLSEIRERAQAATPEPYWRVVYPPEDYDGDEWSLLDGPSKDFKSEQEAKEFSQTKHNKRAPVWAQPQYYQGHPKHGEFAKECDKLLAVIEKLREQREGWVRAFERVSSEAGANSGKDYVLRVTVDDDAELVKILEGE